MELICLGKLPQWINCDLRKFDYSVLGKFHVIMADPPWDIHMSVCGSRNPSIQLFQAILIPIQRSYHMEQ